MWIEFKWGVKTSQTVGQHRSVIQEANICLFVCVCSRSEPERTYNATELTRCLNVNEGHVEVVQKNRFQHFRKTIIFTKIYQ